MIISTPVSLGELVDKISILHIKNKNIKDDEKLKLIREELELLNITLHDHIKKNDIQDFLDTLIRANHFADVAIDSLGIFNDNEYKSALIKLIETSIKRLA